MPDRSERRRRASHTFWELLELQLNLTVGGVVIAGGAIVAVVLGDPMFGLVLVLGGAFICGAALLLRRWHPN
jgi:hypothetical protein